MAKEFIGVIDKSASVDTIIGDMAPEEKVSVRYNCLHQK
jgi:hypothetical protein